MHISDILVEGQRRHVTSLAACVAFICAGQTFAVYDKVLGKYLGMNSLTKNNFYEVIKLMHPVVKEILDEMTEAAKDMMSMDQTVVGAWVRAITTSDGVWLTRGYFSKHFTFTLWDYIKKSLLYYMHLCMKGRDDVIEETLYPGTSKSAEGYAAESVFKQMKDEGGHVETNWQDQDSSSGKSFYSVFTDTKTSKLMLCAGHVNRAHTKQLQELSKMKQVTPGFLTKHGKAYPELKEVKCHCMDKKHSVLWMPN